jgi:glucokinase
VILAGDIGGTKTVLALFEGASGQLRALREEVFPSGDNASLEAIIDQFLTPRQASGLAGASFGVAGPVENGVCKTTNLPWVIDQKALSTKLGGIPVGLLNDVQATAMGTLVLEPNAFAVLQDAPLVDGAPIAVVAPGTGLGEAFLINEGGRYRAYASEGGHADFAPTSDEEVELLRFLRKRYNGHVSAERVLCGNAIGDLYDFIRLNTGAPEPAWLAAEIAKGDRNAAVSRAAIAGTDPTCVKGLEMFVAILGAEAGNMALRMMATGGVVIGGGIPPRILPALQAGGLIARFNDKGRFSSWTKNISVRVALESRAALLGAAHHAVSNKG